MKGITSVVAVILLLLITVALVGFAYVSFQRTTQTVSNAAEDQVRSQVEQSGQRVRIESASGTAVALRNVGSETISASTVAFFINGGFVTCSGLQNMAPSSISNCTLSQTCSAGSRLRVTTSGTEDSTYC